MYIVWIWVVWRGVGLASGLCRAVALCCTYYCMLYYPASSKGPAEGWHWEVMSSKQLCCNGMMLEAAAGAGRRWLRRDNAATVSTG